MKLTEIVISILIFSIVTVAIGAVYYSNEHNSKKSIVKISEADNLLETDRKIRKIIKSVCFSYLDDGEKEIKHAEEKIYETNDKIIDIQLLTDRDNFICGMKVLWTFSDSETIHVTQDVFLSKVICTK